MRPRGLLVLLAVVLAVGAFIAFYERDLPGSDEREEQARRLLPGFEPEEVRALTLTRGGTTVRIERVGPDGAEDGAEDGEDGEDGEDAALGTEDPAGPAAPGEWRLAAPAALAGARADRVAVDGLLQALAALDKTRTLEGHDPAQVGLAPPRARLVLERRDGDPIRLAVGADVPASTGMVIAREEAGEAHVVDRAVWQDLAREPGEWRSREMFPARRDEVRRVVLDGEGAPVVLERQGDGFRVAAPFADLADRRAVDELLGDLTGLRAASFVDDAAGRLGELGLAPPRASVTVDAGVEGGPVRIELGAPADGSGVVVRVGGQVLTAETGLDEAVRQPAAAWRSRSLVPFELYRIDAVEIRGAGEPMRLARDGTDWRRDGATIPYQPVSDLLFALVEATAEEVAPRREAGPPALTLLLTADADAEGGPQRATVALHAPRDGRVPATVSERPVALLLAAATADAVRGHVERVRAAEPVPAAGDEVPDGIEVEREEGP